MSTSDAWRCGYTILDKDGIEQPCDRPAPSWRWYQDVEHEDTLDIACELHENVGGIRMAAAEARITELEVERDAAVRNLGQAMDRVKSEQLARETLATRITAVRELVEELRQRASTNRTGLLDADAVLDDFAAALGEA